MLTNNFRPLISFYSGSNFKNVLGNNIPKVQFLGGQGLNGRIDIYDIGTNSSWATTGAQYRTWVKNNHEYRGSTLSYNYDANANTNTYTKEKETYDWRGVVSQSECSGSSPDYASSIYNGFVVFIGTNDDTENEDVSIETVSADDYCLNNSIELSVIGASCTHNSAEKTSVSRTFENNTEEDVIIKEIGCYVFKTNVSGTATNSSQPVVMIGRKILSTPVTIPVGEQRTFTYVIDMSAISFEEADGE